MLEVREVVVIAMNDHGAVLDEARVEPIRWLSTDCFREPEGEKSNASHESGDDGE